MASMLAAAVHQAMAAAAAAAAAAVVTLGHLAVSHTTTIDWRKSHPSMSM
jgi:hypothetical protein